MGEVSKEFVERALDAAVRERDQALSERDRLLEALEWIADPKSKPDRLRFVLPYEIAREAAASIRESK